MISKSWEFSFLNMSSYYLASVVAQMIKILPAVWETQVQSLGREDPLEKEMATHSRIIVWKVPWTEEKSLVNCSPWGHRESDMTEATEHPRDSFTMAMLKNY